MEVLDIPVSSVDTPADIVTSGVKFMISHYGGNLFEYFAVATSANIKVAVALQSNTTREVYGGKNANGSIVRVSSLKNNIPSSSVFTYTLSNYDATRDLYYYISISGSDNQPIDGSPYPSESAALDAIAESSQPVTYPITYRPTNCSFPNAPTEAAVGENVVVPVTFPDGYGLANESNIYVTNNGVVIPSTYSNGQLTFTMPDPS